MYTSHENQALWRLVEDSYAVQDDDIFCDEVTILMERCAEQLLSDEQSRAQYPQLWRHFRFCRDCAIEYQMLMEMARLQAAGKLKEPDYIPPPPTESPPLFDWARLKESITALFSGFTMQPATMRRSVALMFEPVEVEFDEGDLVITFDLKPNTTDPELRELHCWLETEDEAIEERFEFAPVWLQQADLPDMPVIREQALNELGDVTFSFLSPGSYIFGLYLAEQEYIVKNLTLL